MIGCLLTLDDRKCSHTQCLCCRVSVLNHDMTIAGLCGSFKQQEVRTTTYLGAFYLNCHGTRYRLTDWNLCWCEKGLCPKLALYHPFLTTAYMWTDSQLAGKKYIYNQKIQLCYKDTCRGIQEHAALVHFISNIKWKNILDNERQITYLKTT